MKDIDLLINHFKDLVKRRDNNNDIVVSSFYSNSELYFLKQYLESKEGRSINNYLIYGGNKENDRNMIFLLPTYYELDSFINNNLSMINKSYLSLILITPKNKKYMDKLNHRDVLGTLMNLNIKREFIGDIIVKVDGLRIYVYLKREISDEVISTLVKIKHTFIEVKELGLGSNQNNPDLLPNFIIKNINVSSIRLDNIISNVFSKLSREDSQNLIIDECVFINGKMINKPSYNLKIDDRVSIKGQGKFIYLGINKETKKNRYVISIKLYS